MRSAADRTIARWREAGVRVSVSPDDCARYQRSVSEHRSRGVAAVLQPDAAEQVPALLAIASDGGVPIYPISTGRNWGLGSKLPVVDDCVLLDLSRVARIREVSARQRYVVVEPGVTQCAVADYLREHDLPMVLNVTGAGGHTSLVGNALERGVGILGQRHHDVRGLEVALATGRTVRTGSWRMAGADGSSTHHYPAGLGPDLTGLFMQSNLGVVTAMVLGLSPRQNTRNLLFEFAESGLASVVDAIAGLRASGVVGDRVEIDQGSDPRLAGLVSDPASWVMWVPVVGDGPLIEAREQLVVRALSNLCASPRVFGSDQVPADLPEPARVRLELTAGIPTNFSVESIARTFQVEVGDSERFDLDVHARLPGFLCVLPVIPLEGAALTRVLGIVREVSRAVPVLYGMSFNTVSDTALEGYLRVMFQRTQESSVAQAHRWSDALHRAFREAGVWPMRLDIDQMVSYTDPTDPFWSTVATLKQALDPRGVIAPGRYAPVCA